MAGKRRVVIVSDNLLDRARIEEVAQAAGWHTVGWEPGGTEVDLAVVDLESRDAKAAMSALADTSRVVAFGPHVDTGALAAARSLGADALPRSRFFGGLGDLFV